MSLETAEHEADRMGYDLESLRTHVEKRRENIKVFERAIEDERVGIELDQRMVAHLEEQVRHGAPN